MTDQQKPALMASQLIKVLQAAIDEHGDHPVAINAGDNRIFSALSLEPEMIEPIGGGDSKVKAYIL